MPEVTRGLGVRGMKIGKARYFALIGAMLLLAACIAKPAVSPPTFNVGGKQYHSTAEALEASRVVLNEQAASLGQIPDRIGGRALIVLPDMDRLHPVFAAVLKAPITPATIDFVVTLSHQTNAIYAEALKQANLFDHADIVERNDTEDPPIENYDWLLWFKVSTTGPNHTGAWIGQWHLRNASGAADEPVTFDPGVPEKDRLLSFVKSAKLSAAKLTGGAVATVSLSPVQLANAGAKGSLSGIVISAQGDIITNEHGFNGCNGVRVRSGKDLLSAGITARDHQNDLVLLHVDHAFGTVASFRDGAPLRQGDAVVAVGYPLGQVLSGGPAVTTGTVSALAGLRNDTRFLQISAPIQQGNSGGPLVDSSGHVVGLVTSKLSALLVAAATGDIPQNVNFALKASVVRDFLDTNGVKYRTAASISEQRNAEIADQAKGFAVFIECLK
jgi:S1-C subfamily serine protease